MNKIIYFIACKVDRVLIAFYETVGGADKPCGKVQSWARWVRTRDITANLKSPTNH